MFIISAHVVAVYLSVSYYLLTSTTFLVWVLCTFILVAEHHTAQGLSCLLRFWWISQCIFGIVDLRLSYIVLSNVCHGVFVCT